jgi:hypothetical protein
MHPKLTVHEEEKMFAHPGHLPADPMLWNGRGFVYREILRSFPEA